MSRTLVGQSRAERHLLPCGDCEIETVVRGALRGRPFDGRPCVVRRTRVAGRRRRDLPVVASLRLWEALGPALAVCAVADRVGGGGVRSHRLSRLRAREDLARLPKGMTERAGGAMTLMHKPLGLVIAC
jgi:hypothetical protein